MDVVFSRCPVGSRQFGHDRFRRAGSVPTGVHGPTAFKMNKPPLHDMTQRHDGTIKTDNAPGQGPLAQAKQKRSVHILCIDDDAQIREFLNACLTHFDHRVMIASGGKQGMELFRIATLKNQPYEVVITDLGMPDIDGHHVARTIKAESPNTPVIVMTGWGTTMGDDGETASGVDAVISKPPCMQELNDLILRITAPA
jgi:CheY-like chemotaxis protein